jgi:oligoendopeptidase F
MYEAYRGHNNALAALYGTNVRYDAANAKLRSYSSSLEASLAPANIPLSVYDSLLASVHEHLPAMYKYVSIRKRLLGLDDMSMWDIYVPVASSDDSKYTFEEAVDLISEALSPMGEEYVSVLRKGLREEKWADVFENKGKTSGAYSFGSYDSYPYMLLTFTGKLRDLFTLIHESGHSMHSYYTRSSQPYIYGDHSIFTAEVASTVNENLLMRYLLDRTDDPKLLSYLINFYIDEFKGTVFRQTMFAEFEKAAHEYVEHGGSLSAEWLNNEYDRLNTLYFGPDMTHDDMIQYEWSRIPHFYSSYYVYQYATGFSAATAIAHNILTESEAARDRYIEFLRTGSSDYPIELLRIAGVDMDTPQPVMTALDTFDELVERLDTLTKKC